LIFIFSPPSFDPLNCGVMMYSEWHFANSQDHWSYRDGPGMANCGSFPLRCFHKHSNVVYLSRSAIRSGGSS
jgi:hypothetical protein